MDRKTSDLKMLQRSLLLALSVAAPAAHASTITVDFDAINALAAPVSNATLDSYLSGFGITITSESSSGGNMLVSVRDDRQNFGGLAISASSSHNVLSQLLSNPAATTLSQAVAAGSTGVRLASTAGRAAGDIIAIGNELATIASIVSPAPPSPAPNVTLTAPLAQAHASATSVTPRGKSGSVSYTLSFSTPVDSVTFTRVLLVSAPSNVTYPTWIAEALDASSAVIDSTGEGVISGVSNVSAQVFSLDGAAGISAIRFTSSDMASSLSGAMLDDFVLTVDETTAVPAPAPIWLFTLGLAGMGFTWRRKA
jgi:hypothetical protein